MKRFLAIIALFAGCFVLSCRDEDTVWILNVFAVTYGIDDTTVPVNGCPRVTWRFDGSGTQRTEPCRNGNRVKVWKTLEHDVTISYYVSCAGYESSPEFTATFHKSDARDGPDSEGPEVTVNNTVFLYLN